MKKIITVVGVVILTVVGIMVFSKQQDKPGSNNPSGTTQKIEISQDVCGEFPGLWVQSVMHKAIIKTEPFSMSGTSTCKYYIDENNFITLRLNNLNFENQKNGQRSLGRTIQTNANINMNHFIAVQSDNLINNIVLEVNPNLFISVDRSSTKAAAEEEIVDFAVQVSQRISKGENRVSISESASTSSIQSSTIPFPQETDIIRNFVNLIGEKRISEAVGMMSKVINNDDNQKQSWGVQLNAMKSVKVVSVEPSMQEEWSSTKHTYKIVFEVSMDPSSATAPIPYYGYENGRNIRWISLIKEGSLWKIEGIATGP